MICWNPSTEDVASIRGLLDFPEQYIFARKASSKLRQLLEEEKYIATLGAIEGTQAIQLVHAGLKSIYLSGWQTAAMNNDSDQMYPDMGLYHSSSVPTVIRKINNSLKRAAQIDQLAGKNTDYLCPIIADAEHGFGSPLKVFELIKEMITEGVAGIHLENQVCGSHDRKCGHLSQKVLIPCSAFIKKLKAARLAATVCNVDMVIIARTDAQSAQYITSDIDEVDKPFIIGGRTEDDLYKITGGLDMAIANGLAFAPYADMLWMETSTPNLDDAKKFADAIHSRFPGKWLTYNCSPSFNWSKYLSATELYKFQENLGDMGYKFQFVTLAGFHSLNLSMFNLARDYVQDGMYGYANLQEREFNQEVNGYTATKHQSFVGVPYFDKVAEILGSHSALAGSTEQEQF